MSAPAEQEQELRAPATPKSLSGTRKSAEPRAPRSVVAPDPETPVTTETDRAALLALFRLLMREPPADHDFTACPICKRYGITGI